MPDLDDVENLDVPETEISVDPETSIKTRPETSKDDKVRRNSSARLKAMRRRRSMLVEDDTK